MTVTQIIRRLSPRFLDRLEVLSKERGNWWNDLLSQWGPSGTALGLRAAVRDNYLNFYASGQSVALIRPSRDGVALRIHGKYVAGSGADGQRRFSPFRGADAAGLETDWSSDILCRWVDAAATYKNQEKTLVEQLVAANPNVIDLEACISGNRARMDIVALERDGEKFKVVFWEAKRLSDGRLRAADLNPEVERQLKVYADFLSVPEHRKVVGQSYAMACDILVRLRDMAGNSERTVALDDIIIEAAENPDRIVVDPVPRLVILDEGERRDEARWQMHAAILRRVAKTSILPAGTFDLSYAEGQS